jgi:osmoprotectant transport system substrate-binding protein
MKRIAHLVALGAAAALALTACGGSSDDNKSNPLSGGGNSGASGGGTVTVGSANFPESAALAEIYAQALEAKGIKVARKFNIGAREIYYNQVVSGGIDVVPEYNGALLTTSVDKTSTAVTTDEVNAALQAKLPAAVGILTSSKAEDKDSITVNAQTAQKYNLKSISDLKAVASQLTIGGPSEFKTRAQGLVGLKSKYGVVFKKFQPVDAGAQSSLESLLSKNNIQAADIFTTDPTIATSKFVILDDPLHLFAAQNVTPLIYKSAVNAQAQAALNAVSAKLTTQDLQNILQQITVDKKDQETVAKSWLQQAGLA